MNRKKTRIAVIMMLTVMLTGLSTLTIQSRERGVRGPGWNMLDEGQKEEIRSMVQQMRSENAEGDAIRAAVDAKLEEWDIEKPEGAEGGFGRGRGGHPGLFGSDVLTEAQKTEIQDMVKNLQEQDAGREAIRAAVDAKLEEWGIEKPERPKDGFGRGRGGHPGLFGSDVLTEAQKTEIQDMVKSLKEQNAERDAIRAAVDAKLNEWGIEKPERPKDGFGRGRGRQGRHSWMNQLDETQKEEVRELVRSMKGEDKSRQEIHQAIRELAAGYGIELPERNGRADRGQSREETHSGPKNMRAVNRPNPFNPETVISYQIESPADVTVAIYNLQGQQVRLLTQQYQQAGEYEVRWDGKTETGMAAPSGMYIYRISTPEMALSHRMLLMK